MRDAARLRLARVALAVMEYKQANGAWPESLNSIRDLFGGELPGDPYSGGDFQYQRAGGEVRLYAAAGYAEKYWDMQQDDLLAWVWQR